eukprot:GHVO01003953.1.p1 GENE.GHVO01003953.1~~GHVO01003953.1.p1  ORF type:complete len:110 (-),score=0.30 GHVO01003953.1:35-364(-)
MSLYSSYEPHRNTKTFDFQPQSRKVVVIIIPIRYMLVKASSLAAKGSNINLATPWFFPKPYQHKQTARKLVPRSGIWGSTDRASSTSALYCWMLPHSAKKKKKKKHETE